MDAASGVIPIRPKTKPIRAFSEAIRTSIAQVIVAPMPTAGPLIAAITGLGQSKIASVTRPPVSRRPRWISGSSSRSRMSAGVGCSDSSSPNTLPSTERSIPAQNARPRPVTTTARTASSRPARPNASTSSSAISTVNALSWSGRSSHRVSTPSSARSQVRVE